MNTITVTGNLAAAPELRYDKNNKPYTFARVLVTDRVRQNDGTFVDGGTIGYDAAVWGSDAEGLVQTALDSGNIRVTVSGDYLVELYQPEGGEPRLTHRILDAEVSVSFRGQSITVEKRSAAE